MILLSTLRKAALTTFLPIFVYTGMVFGRDQLPINPALERDQLLKCVFS